MTSIPLHTVADSPGDAAGDTAGDSTGDAAAQTTADPALPAGLAAAWEAVTTPVLVHDEANIVHANDAMLRLLGYDAQSLAAMPFDAWAAPDHREALRAYGFRPSVRRDRPPRSRSTR